MTNKISKDIFQSSVSEPGNGLSQEEQTAISPRIEDPGASPETGGELAKCREALEAAAGKARLLDLIPTPVMAVDKEFNVTFMNQAGATAVGRSPEDCLGKKCFSLFNTNQCNTANCQVKMAMEQDGVFTDDTIAKLPSGELPIRYTGTPLKDENGRVVGGLEYVLDISEEMEITNGVMDLAKAAVEGRLDTRADASKFEGNYRRIVQGVNDTLDAVIGPLNVAAEYVDRISKGDIPEKITDEYKGDFNEIKNNLNQCIDAVNGLVYEAAMLTEAAKEGRLDTRGDISKFSGDYATIVGGVNETLDSVIGPLNVAAEYVDRISKGDIPEPITDEYKGDFNEIKNNLNQCIEMLNTLITEMNHMSREHDAGDIDVVMDTDKFQGAYATMAQGVNDMVSGHISVKKKAMACVKEFGEGNFEAELEKFPGKKAFINDTVEMVRANLKDLIKETNMLVEAAVAGKLDTRGDASKFKGDYARIVGGVNDTLDAVIGPLNVAAEYVDRISKGDIPEKITDEYKGDFNEIKNNLNNCVDIMNGLLEETAKLVEATVEGQLDTRGNADGFAGGWGKLVGGVNNLIDAFVGPINVTAEYVDRISKGDIPEKITDEYKGDFNEIKNNLNQCVDIMNNLLGETNTLVKAAVNGQLDTRADAEKFAGGWGELVGGVNELLDAVIGPLNVAAEYVDRISKGDIPEKITDEYKGDFNEIKNNLNQCIEAVGLLVEDAGMLAGAAEREEFSMRADETRHSGDFSKVVMGMNQTFDRVAGKLYLYESSLDAIPFPVSVTDPDMNWLFFNKAVATLTGLKREEMLGKPCNNWNADICQTERCGIQMLRKGEPTSFFKQPGQDMDFRVDTQFILDNQGEKLGHIEIIQDITAANRVKEYQDEEVQRLAANLAEFANGNLDIDTAISEGNEYTKEVRENFLKIKDALDKAIEAVRLLSDESDMLTKAAVEGKLDTRGDADKFGGGFAKIVQGVNDTLDAVIGPLNVAAEYVDRISKGDIPEKITDEYKGDFNEIKNNLNNCVDIMNGLLDETAKLVEATVEGRLDTRGNADAFAGGWGKLVGGVNNLIDAFVGPINVTAEYVDRISKGDIPERITDEYKGDFNEIKNNLNQCVDIMNSLLGETNGLVEAAVEGKLDTRADAEKFPGGWGQLVGGVNRCLDAVIGPLNVAAEYVDRISKGDIPEQISDEYKGDFNEIKNNLNMLIEAMNEVTRLAQEIAGGNLTVRVDKRSEQDELMIALERMVKDLTGIAANMQEAAEQVAAGSQQISSGTEEMSQGATEASSSVEEVSSSMEEMNSTVSQNADNARQTASIAEKAAKDAQEGGKSVSDTVKAMKDIAEKIGIIEEIARQTNMLALNAAIEAARAGDAGRGFAVVAAEVRKLAERSQTAAKEISGLSGTSVEIAEKAGKLIEEIVPGIQKTAELVQEINASSAEQADGIQQVTKAIQQLDEVTQQNASATEQMSSTSEELASQAEQLREAAAFFKIETSHGQGVQQRRVARIGAPKKAVVEKTGIPAGTRQKRVPELRAGAERHGSGSPAGGVSLDMGDADDSEFERY
jgi:methyl-accepting chemotaxis protein